MCPDFPQKWQTHAGLSCVLPLGGLGALGLDSWRSTLIFLGGVTSTDLALLIKDLTTSLIGGLEEEEGTKFMELGADTEMLSIKPKPVLSNGRLLNTQDVIKFGACRLINLFSSNR